VVRAGGVWSDAAECDIGFLGADGAVRAELFGVSLIARPNLPETRAGGHHS